MSGNNEKAKKLVNLRLLYSNGREERYSVEVVSINFVGDTLWFVTESKEEVSIPLFDLNAASIDRYDN